MALQPRRQPSSLKLLLTVDNLSIAVLSDLKVTVAVTVLSYCNILSTEHANSRFFQLSH
jgi:hypothetical protein